MKRLLMELSLLPSCDRFRSQPALNSAQRVQNMTLLHTVHTLYPLTERLQPMDKFLNYLGAHGQTPSHLLEHISQNDGRVQTAQAGSDAPSLRSQIDHGEAHEDQDDGHGHIGAAELGLDGQHLRYQPLPLSQHAKERLALSTKTTGRMPPMSLAVAGARAGLVEVSVAAGTKEAVISPGPGRASKDCTGDTGRERGSVRVAAGTVEVVPVSGKTRRLIRLPAELADQLDRSRYRCCAMFSLTGGLLNHAILANLLRPSLTFSALGRTSGFVWTSFESRTSMSRGIWRLSQVKMSSGEGTKLPDGVSVEQAMSRQHTQGTP